MNAPVLIGILELPKQLCTTRILLSLCDGAGVNDCTHHFQLLVRGYLYTKFIWNSQIKKGKVSSAYLVTFDLSIRRSDPN